MTSNPIYKNDLWVTPTFDQLQHSIEQLSMEERQIAYHYTFITMNMCHKYVQDALDAEKKLTA
jgi:hypothetical protein